MTGHDAEPTLSTTGEQGTGMEQRWGERRQRAADLFSPHRYRALQLSLFERKAGGAAGGAAADASAPRGLDRFAPVPMTGAVPVAAPDAYGAPHAPDAAAAPAAYGDAGYGQDARGAYADPQGAHRAAGFPPTGGAPLSEGAAALESFADAVETAPLGTALVEGQLVEAGGEWGIDPSGAALGAEADADPAVAHAWVSSNGEWPAEPAVSWDDVPATDDPANAPATQAPGRNLRVATLVGVGLLIVAVVGAWVHPIAFAVLLYAFACGAVIEWKRALERHGRTVPLIPLLAATVGMGVATWFAKPEGLVVALLVGCAGVVAWRIGDERMENTLADSLAGILTLLWIPFLASFLFLLEIADDGWQRVVIIVLAVVGNDTGGLIAGMTLGRHKLLPRVSPAKTWEGAAGGVLLGTAAASGAAFLFFDGQWFIGAAVGAAAAIAAIIGDLSESALKRDIRLKDMSSAIPGHGGILDRIDSLLFAAPVGYVVFAIFLGTLGGGGL